MSYTVPSASIQNCSSSHLPHSPSPSTHTHIPLLLSDSPKTATLAADSSDVEDFKVTVARLKSKLQDREQAHHIEMQESKETIANLSSKVENLKMEMVKLRQSLPRHLGRGGEGVGIEGGASIMFTRLDAERNRKTLQGALEKEWSALISL